MTEGNAPEQIHELAALYALGALTQHEARACEARLSAGERAWVAAVRDCEQVVYWLSYAAPAAAPRKSVRLRLLDRIAASPQAAATSAKSGFVATHYQDIRWKEIQPGIFAKVLYKDPIARTISTLYRLAPGTIFTSHTHTGSEQCFILEGDFVVNGEPFGPGDFHCATPGSTHELITTTQGTVLLVIAPTPYQFCS